MIIFTIIGVLFTIIFLVALGFGLYIMNYEFNDTIHSQKQDKT